MEVEVEVEDVEVVEVARDRWGRRRTGAVFDARKGEVEIITSLVTGVAFLWSKNGFMAVVAFAFVRGVEAEEMVLVAEAEAEAEIFGAKKGAKVDAAFLVDGEPAVVAEIGSLVVVDFSVRVIFAVDVRVRVALVAAVVLLLVVVGSREGSEGYEKEKVGRAGNEKADEKARAKDDATEWNGTCGGDQRDATDLVRFEENRSIVDGREKEEETGRAGPGVEMEVEVEVAVEVAISARRVAVTWTFDLDLDLDVAVAVDVDVDVDFPVVVRLAGDVVGVGAGGSLGGEDEVGPGFASTSPPGEEAEGGRKRTLPAGGGREGSKRGFSRRSKAGDTPCVAAMVDQSSVAERTINHFWRGAGVVRIAIQRCDEKAVEEAGTIGAGEEEEEKEVLLVGAGPGGDADVVEVEVALGGGVASKYRARPADVEKEEVEFPRSARVDILREEGESGTRTPGWSPGGLDRSVMCAILAPQATSCDTMS